MVAFLAVLIFSCSPHLLAVRHRSGRLLGIRGRSPEGSRPHQYVTDCHAATRCSLPTARAAMGTTAKVAVGPPLERTR
jgi:hypothetical protein